MDSMRLISTLIAGGILTTATALTITDVTTPAAETVGASSIGTVVRAAQPGALLGYETWPEALANAAAGLSQGGEAITVEGTTVRWIREESCVEADVPDVWAKLVVVPCVLS